MIQDVAMLLHVRLLYPDFRRRAMRAIAKTEARTNIRMLCPQGARAWKKQAELFAIGRTVKGVCSCPERPACPKHPMGRVVTKARPGHSAHQFLVALDVAFAIPGDPYLDQREDGDSIWRHWGASAQEEGLQWGGDWDGDDVKDPDDWDRPHAQIRYGMKIADMRFLYYSKGIEGVFMEFDRRRGAREGEDWLHMVPELITQGFGKPNQGERNA